MLPYFNPEKPVADFECVAAFILASVGRAVSEIAKIFYSEYLYSAEYNMIRNPTFGVCQMNRYHLVLTTNPIERLSWCDYYVVYCDGGLKKISVLPPAFTGTNAWILWSYFASVEYAAGLDTWIWLGYFVPPISV